MTFKLFNKRIHLYLGLFFMLFFLKYAVSGIFYSHDFGLNEYYKKYAQWNKQFERHYTRPVPEDADLRQIGAQILKDANIKKRSFNVRADKERLNINTQSFFSDTRVTYFMNEERLLVEEKIFRWDHFLQKFHWIGGYQQDNFICDAWAFTLDLVFIATIIWVVSGIYLWWKILKTRLWGSITLGAGVISFLLFIMFL